MIICVNWVKDDISNLSDVKVSMFTYCSRTKMALGRNNQFLLRLLRSTALQHSFHPSSTTYQEPFNKQKIYSFSEIPGPTGLFNIPYLGAALHFKPFTKFTIQELPNLLNCMRERYGDIHTLKFGKSTTVFLHHPDYVKALLQQPYKLFIRPPLHLLEIFHERNEAPKTLTILKGDDWVALRKPAQEKMLRPAVVASYVPLIVGVTNDFINRLRRKGKTDDLLPELMNYTTESVCMLCFNKRYGCLDDGPPAELIEHIRTFFTCLQESFYLPVKTFLYYRTKLYQDFERARLSVNRMVKFEFNEQIEFLQQLEKTGSLDEYLEKDPNFMYSLISDPRMDENSINSVVTTLITAGIDSTANSLVFALADLALHPDKQAAAYEEIRSVLGDSPELTKEHLSKLSYLKACVKESQRLTFPTMLGTGRITEFDIVIGDYQIPSGTVVMSNMVSMCMDERFFPRPGDYAPERWLRTTKDDIARGQDFPFVMLPFGYGPRGCLGQRFAEMEMYIVLSKILQNFEVKLPPGVTEVKSIYRTFASPVEKVEMHFIERK